MSGATTELSLATAVDSDDNADYLTIALANSLRTVDALFNNVTGHTHNGAHQGGPVVIGAGSIPNGLITTPMLAAGAVSQVGFAVGSTATPSTTSTTYVDMPEMSVTLTTVGGIVLAFLQSTTAFTAGAAGTGVLQMALSLDGAAEVGLTGVIHAALNYQAPVATLHNFGALAAGSHTIKGRWLSSTASVTMALSGIQRRLLVVELKR